MAKSIRSKRMRKLRAIKRARNAPREMKRLKKILGLLKPEEEEPEKQVYKFQDVRDLILNKPTVNQASGTKYDLRFVPDRDQIKAANQTTEDSKMEGDADSDTEANDQPKIPKIRLQNEHGNYPLWMSHRRIKKMSGRKGRPSKHKGGKIGKSKI